MTPITINEGNMTSTLKKLFISKAPSAANPVKIASKVLEVNIQ